MVFLVSCGRDPERDQAGSESEKWQQGRYGWICDGQTVRAQERVDAERVELFREHAQEKDQTRGAEEPPQRIAHTGDQCAAEQVRRGCADECDERYGLWIPDAGDERQRAMPDDEQGQRRRHPHPPGEHFREQEAAPVHGKRPEERGREAPVTPPDGERKGEGKKREREPLVGIEPRVDMPANEVAREQERREADDDGDAQRYRTKRQTDDADLLAHDVASSRRRMNGLLHHRSASSARKAIAASSSASGVTSRTVAPAAARRAVTSSGSPISVHCTSRPKCERFATRSSGGGCHPSGTSKR